MPEWTKADFDLHERNPAMERWGLPNTRPAITLAYHWANRIAAQAGVSWQGVDVTLQAGSPLDGLTRPQALVNILGLLANEGVILVGAGFNGTGAGLTALGIRVLGTDVSTYIQNEKGNTEEAEIRAACIAAGVDPDTDQVRGPSGLVNPLDLFMEGGRASPAVRGKGEVLAEELRTRGSRNAVINRVEQLWPGQTIRYIISEEVLNSITDAEADLVCDYMSAGAVEWGSTCVHMLSPLQTGVAQSPSLNWKTYAGWRSWLDTNGYSSHLILPTVTASGQGMTFPIDNGEAGRVLAYSGTF